MFIRSTIRMFRAAPKRLRITPTPYHDDALIDALAEALVDVWGTLDRLCDTARSRQNERVTYWHPLAAPLLRFRHLSRIFLNARTFQRLS